MITDGLTPSDTLKFSWNQSKRFCGICDEDCTNSSISGHIQLTHNLSISDYNLKHVTPVQNISHRCLLCQHEVIFSQRHVELHLKSHEISLLQYEQVSGCAFGTVTYLSTFQSKMYAEAVPPLCDSNPWPHC